MYCLQKISCLITILHLSFDLVFLIGQFRYLFRSRNFTAILFILPILEIRFDYTYRSVLNNINWRESFCIEIDFFDTLIAGISAKQFACDATISDKRNIDLLCSASFKYRDVYRIFLKSKSNAIIIEIAEYCVVHSSLIYYFEEIVEISKYYFIWSLTQLILALEIALSS